jgi:hypothetical protein
LTATARADYETTYHLDFLGECTLPFQFSYSDGIKTINSLTLPTLTSHKLQLFASPYVTSISVKDITLSKDGIIYYVLERIQEVTWEDLWLHKVYTDVTTPITPTPIEIFNC